MLDAPPWIDGRASAPRRLCRDSPPSLWRQRFPPTRVDRRRHDVDVCPTEPRVPSPTSRGSTTPWCRRRRTPSRSTSAGAASSRPARPRARRSRCLPNGLPRTCCCTRWATSSTTRCPPRRASASRRSCATARLGLRLVTGSGQRAVRRGLPLCARRASIRERYAGGYDYSPTPAQHRQVCALDPPGRRSRQMTTNSTPPAPRAAASPSAVRRRCAAARPRRPATARRCCASRPDRAPVGPSRLSPIWSTPPRRPRSPRTSCAG